MKRIRPRAQGRAYRIRKRSSHITVIVSDGTVTAPVAKAKPAPKAAEKPAATKAPAKKAADTADKPVAKKATAKKASAPAESAEKEG